MFDAKISVLFAVGTNEQGFVRVIILLIFAIKRIAIDVF